MAYRILSIDGGGIRGIVSGIILKRIMEKRGNEKFFDEIDLIVGTSSGGLTALALAHGVSIDRIISLFVDKGRSIFQDSIFDDILDLNRFVGAEYDNDILEKELRAIFQDSTLADLNKKVVIPVFDLDNDADKNRTWKPKLFHNLSGPDNDEDLLLYKVSMYTSAAPTYFPSVDGYIDGGVYANCPAMCAVSQTQDERYQPTPDLSDIRLLSIGTGRNLQFIEGDALDWGYIQWAKPLINIMLDGFLGITDYHCEKILGDNYHRQAPLFPSGESISLDSVEHIHYLQQFAKKVNLRDTFNWIDESWS